MAMDRLSDHRFCANYFRLYLHAAALNLLVKEKRRTETLMAAVEEALEFAEDQEDVVDGDYGFPAPNRAMLLAQSLRAALAKVAP